MRIWKGQMLLMAAVADALVLPKALPSISNQHSLEMRDRSSSYWFSVGDRVSVIQDVYSFQRNLKGMEGTVVETWEKCDVDPTCCCAEQVDTNMAVRVLFQDQNTTLVGSTSIRNEASFSFYFAEDELIQID